MSSSDLSDLTETEINDSDFIDSGDEELNLLENNENMGGIEELNNQNNFQINFEQFQQNINNIEINNDDNINIFIKVLPFIFCENIPKPKYNSNGNKIVCPKYILSKVSNYKNVAYPITLKINDRYFGILEFKDFIDELYIPNNLFYELEFKENEYIDIEILKEQLPKASYIKIKPLDEEFYIIENKKKYFEIHLKNLLNVISKNTIIHIPYSDKTIQFLIMDCLPEDSVSIDEIEKLELDIEPIKEPSTQVLETSIEDTKDTKDNEKKGFKSFSGTGYSLK